MTAPSAASDRRPTQDERRARTRGALLEAAARRISRDGYGNLVLERVAREAGYTRGALYHLFAGKEDLALAVVGWVEETWYAELGHLFVGDADPVGALLALARGHAVYCRRDIARVMMTLRVEFNGRDDAVARAIDALGDRITTDCERLIARARRNRSIPPGPAPRSLAVAYLAALDGLMIQVGGKTPSDVALAERVARGVLALPPADPRGAR